MNNDYNSKQIAEPQKRVIAYIIDGIIFFVGAFIVTLILAAVFGWGASVKGMSAYENGQPIMEYIKESLTVEGEAMYETRFAELVNLFLAVMYFFLIPLLLKGQTIGKKIMNIRIVNMDDRGNFSSAKAPNLFLRELLQFAYSVIIILIMFTVVGNDGHYLMLVVLSSVLGLLSGVLLIISLIMLMQGPKRQTIEDKIAKTAVIDEAMNVSNNRELQDENNNVDPYL